MKYSLQFLVLSLFLSLSVFANEDCTPTSSVLTDIITDISDHLNGGAQLTDADFENNHISILDHISDLASDMEAINMTFDLIELYEFNYGTMFINSNTGNGFNKAYTSDNKNIHRNMILFHQGLIDHTFTRELVKDNPGLFNGKMFLTANYFPGIIDGLVDQNNIESATVRCSYLLAEGSQPWAGIGNENVIRPTGFYLAPGTIAEITVPEALIANDIKIRVGAHYWDLNDKSQYKRLDRVSITYDVELETTQIAHPLGGGIYFEIPLGIDFGEIEIELKNVTKAPFFSMKTFHETSLEEWQETQRNNPAPWADFETDKFMMQVPTKWIYNFDDPKTLLEDWDKSMDAVSDLLGRPRVTDRHKNYLQFDVIIRGGAYHPGYPMSNTPYNPYSFDNGVPEHNILKGPQFGQDIHFHELGHEVAISKFVGETEAIVNFLYVPVLNQHFGYTLDEAFAESFGPSYNYYSTKENTVRTRMVAETFELGQERNTCSCTKNEVRYQPRGYAHYVDIVELYGWEALNNFWHAESEAAANGNPFPVNNQEQDDRIFRMSQAAGYDLRPLFHFWGIIPFNQGNLAQRMEDNDLKLPMSIKEKLHTYRSLIPPNKDAFIELGNDLHPAFQNYSGDQFDFGAGWYKNAAESYDSNQAVDIEDALSEIIKFYYGTDCFQLEAFISTDFGFETQICANNETITLPTTSNNGIVGMWNPAEIDASIAGQYDIEFCPELEECTVETKLNYQVSAIEVDIIDDNIIVTGGIEPYQVSIDTIGNIQTITVVDAIGCQYSIDLTLSNTDLSEHASLKIYPNPVLHELFIEHKEINTSIQSIKMISVNGQVVEQYSGNQTVLDVSEFQSGMYIVRITFDDGIQIDRKLTILK